MEENTGIVRRVDDLGRIVLPKELRRTLQIKEGTPMLILISGDNVVLKKYYPEKVMLALTNNLMEAAEDAYNNVDPGKTESIRRHVEEIRQLLEP